MLGPNDYRHEDDLLAWLDSVDGDVLFMEYRNSPKGQKRTDEQVRADMRTLVRLGLAEYTYKHRTGQGDVPWKAEITGTGVTVVRSHSGSIFFWEMSGRRQTPPAPTANYYTTNIGRDVIGSQVATAGGDASQTQALNARDEAPSQAEAVVRSLFARSYDLVAQLSGPTESLQDEIEDAEAAVVDLLRAASAHAGDRGPTVAAIQRRLQRVAARVEEAVGHSDFSDATDLLRDLRGQFIK